MISWVFVLFQNRSFMKKVINSIRSLGKEIDILKYCLWTLFQNSIVKSCPFLLYPIHTAWQSHHHQVVCLCRASFPIVSRPLRWFLFLSEWQPLTSPAVLWFSRGWFCNCQSLTSASLCFETEKTLTTNWFSARSWLWSWESRAFRECIPCAACQP